MRSQTPTRTFMTDGEEDEFDDTLLAQIDELLASAKPTATIISPEDKFFDEITELLNETDRKKSLPVVNKESSGEFDPDDFFDQILHDIPKNERPQVRWHGDETSTDINEEIEKIENGLAKIDAQTYRLNQRAALVKKNKLGAVDPKINEQHLTQHLNAIILLVRKLTPWSPAKNQYNKIIMNANLSTHMKLQQLIWTANKILELNSQKKKGFLIERSTRKANAIHTTIAAIDLNDEKTSELNMETFRKM